MDPAQTLELELQQLSEQLTAPGRTECLSCYLGRVLPEFGCARHRFTRRWAQGRARGTPDGLVRWASGLGGCCCDCEVVLNVLGRPAARRRGGLLCVASVARLGAPDEPAGPVPCGGVRP